MNHGSRRKAYHEKRILVVDDEADVRAAVLDALEGAALDTAATAGEARAKLSAGLFDLVVLDVMGVEGLEILEEIDGRTPAIVLTAHALTPAALRRSIRGGARLFLPKEELGRLDEHVERVLGPAPRSHWGWLFGKVDFGRAFGRAFGALKAATLAVARGIDALAEDVPSAAGPAAGAGPALLEHLGMPDPEVRALAATGLGMIRDRAALPRLRDLARDDPSPEVRHEAAWAVRQVERASGLVAKAATSPASAPAPS